MRGIRNKGKLVERVRERKGEEWQKEGKRKDEMGRKGKRIEQDGTEAKKKEGKVLRREKDQKCKKKRVI